MSTTVVHGGGVGGSSSGASASGFPLRANFFRSLPLSKETADALYASAKDNAAACLKQSFNEQWRYVPPEKDGTQLRKDTSNLMTSCRYVRAATVLRCQEHEVDMIIANTNTESWREFMRKCFGKHYIDTMILHSFSGPSSTKDTTKDVDDNNRVHRAATDGAERQTLWLHGPLDLETEDNNNNDKHHRNSDTQSVPSDEETAEEPEELLTVKWGAFDTNGQGKRDLCVLDYLSTAYIPNTDNKERVHMWCFSSVEGERVGCMALKDTHSIARATLAKLGVFWRRVNDEETEVIVCGSFASKHAKYVSAIFLHSLNRLQGIVEDLRLSNQIYIHRSTWVKDHERSSCHLCMRNFYALRRKHHCRKCGEVICSDCSVVENVDLPVIGYSKLRLCKVCCLKAKSTPLKRNDKSNVFDHLVRARSLSNMHAVASSPYNARMSFVDSGSGSGGSTNGHNSHNSHNQFQHSNQHAHFQQHTASIAAAAAARAERELAEASSLSSSSFSSSNTNDFELTDSLDEYAQMHAPAAAAAIVHPMSKEMRGLSNGTMGSSTSAASSTPMLATQDDDDYDDFIDARSLNKQLSAMEQKHKQKHGGSPANSMFDLLCELACQTLNCPIASVSIKDPQHGDVIHSARGIDGLPELDEELTLFIEKVMGSTPTIVLDANLDRHVTSLFTRRGGPAIRYFAGCPIYSRGGEKLGFICVADVTKRDTLGPSSAFTMERLATLAVTTMEKNLTAKQQNGDREYCSPAASTPMGASYTNGTHSNHNNQKSHNQNGQYTDSRQQPQHPAAIFDRAPASTSTRHRQSNAQMNHVHVQHASPQYQTAAQAYQYQDAYAAQAMHARVYDLSDPDVPVMVGSPVNYQGSRPAPPPPPSSGQAPPVAPLPRQYNEYSAGYYEAQERMRKLLLKSYHTQQQLATGNGTPPSSGPASAAFHAQY